MAQHREESYRGPTRRSLLKASMAAAAAWAAPWVVPASVLGENPPSSRIHVGFIGTGNQSTGDDEANAMLGRPLRAPWSL